MNILLGCAFILIILYLLVSFARQECVQEEYENAILDVEGRLDWAHSRSSFPFGMKSQLQVCRRFLKQAKFLWTINKWHQAYSVVLQSQKAMDRAQTIYRNVLTNQESVNDHS